ncbi:hypothetical protein C4Q31_17620 [Leptospira borgpetersenii serovar Ceylonica]|nr:hypothetical protein C4Q31_17620 [Leptospira borgpetersenii serovar Ceylonica]QHE28616.1 hypothetical protein GS524_16590 [Leptospira borgpetersenii]QHE31917.1 hypothetical protein GS523_16585 [Leptospira borgpetersenii]QHE35217.1 hypothetical protein GS517_16585 [Leptospira borgpetersenii]QHE38450.1 hypothetical protein GS510_16230 [Leptospira borgpetersenii]
MGKYVYKEFVFFSKQVKINFYQNGNIRTCPKLSSVGAALPCKVLSPLNVGVPTSEVLGQILRKNSKIYRNLEIRRLNSYPFPKNVCALLQ